MAPLNENNFGKTNGIIFSVIFILAISYSKPAQSTNVSSCFSHFLYSEGCDFLIELCWFPLLNTPKF